MTSCPQRSHSKMVKFINLNNFFSDNSGLKGIQNGQIGNFCQKTQKRRLFGPKMTSYVKNRHGGTNFFFQKVKLINLNNFFYDSSGLKGIQNGQNWSFLSKNAKKTYIPVRNDVIRQKWWKLPKKFFLQNIQKIKGNNFFYNSFAQKRL